MITCLGSSMLRMVVSFLSIVTSGLPP
uniref:Uncharacterized protein n=1 Tax=Arundo donax TaxID=35708 RepID=A0A0A8YLR5_ARUDO